MGFQFGRFRAPWWALAVAVSVVTMVLGGTVVIVATPAGCRAAQNLGLHTSSNNCGDKGATGGFVVPTPTLLPIPQTPFPTTQVTSPTLPPPPSPSPLAPYEYPTSSDLQPFAVPGSSPFPPGSAPTCRLPIDQGQPGSGGFIVFPAGSYVADPRSGVTLPSTAPSPAPNQYGGGFAGFGLSYDHLHDRWLPVPYSWVVPDATHYVYPGQQGVYVVNVADSTVSELGEGKQWIILSVTAQGVYGAVPQLAGLWFLPFSGSAQQITASGYWQAVGGGAAYGTSSSAVPQGVPNPILRLDLKTGASEPWFAVDQGNSSVVGFDLNGSPIITVSGGDNGSYLWVAPSVGHAIEIAILSGTYAYYYNQTFISPNWPPIADAHGIWIGGQATYVFTPNSKWYEAATFGGLLAGPCT
ncbi:MAG: hypothetical protein ACHQ0J_08135 [Candidatus Dormibacterales bacterium]